MSALAQLGIKDNGLKKRPFYSKSQEQTKNAFGYQWSQRHSYESEAAQKFARKWLLERYCGNNPRILDKWLADKGKIIFDAGCGAAYSAIALFGDHLKSHHYLGVDISDAVYVAKKRFQEAGYPGDFLKKSILNLRLPPNSVDLIFSEGVLHHTDNTEKAFKKLVKFLKPKGRFLFYVYAKKAPLREFTDDYIREQLRPLDDPKAWKALYPLTKLGIALGKLNTVINVPKDIPYLGIKKGKMDLQRFFYWNICKVFYRPEYSFEEMNHMNFDWFRPLNCHRHTPEEVRRWCREAGLRIEHINIQEAGITVVAVKI